MDRYWQNGFVVDMDEDEDDDLLAAIECNCYISYTDKLFCMAKGDTEWFIGNTPPTENMSYPIRVALDLYGKNKCLTCVCFTTSDIPLTDHLQRYASDLKCELVIRYVNMTNMTPSLHKWMLFTQDILMCFQKKNNLLK